MATLSTTMPTLLDLAKGQGPDGKQMTVIEMLAQTNEMLQDIPVTECNDGTTHVDAIRTGLPAVYWRMINQGVTPSKSTKVQVREGTGMLEAWSECDQELADLSGDASGYRLSEAIAFMESMNQEMQGTLMYGNVALNSEEFTGFAPRYSALSGYANSANVINAAGTQDSPSDLSSLWLISWGPQTVHGLYPKGMVAGLQHIDRGLQTAYVEAGLGTKRMLVYQDIHRWKLGLIVKDWRYVVRAVNIDISDVLAQSTATLPFILRRMLASLPNRLGRPVFYASRTLKFLIEEECQRDVKAGGGIAFENVEGRTMTTFQGVPIRICDGLLDTETAVS